MSRLEPLEPAGLPPATVTHEEARAARRSLRAQIAHLERELSETLVAAFPRSGIPREFPAPARGPRLLSLGELEEVRDALVARRSAQRTAHQQLAAMFAAPAEHRYETVTLRELGEEGCCYWQVRPRLGLIGKFTGWWHVKLSSGCPLP